jgi:transcription antitermination protein NusB
VAGRERPARRARRLAMVALFEAEFPPQQAGRALERLAADWEAEPAVVEHSRAIVSGVARHTTELDAEIAARAPKIPVAELGRIERTILRSALFEVLYSAAIPSGTIRDAVSLARTYAGESAARLVGGVLRSVARPEPVRPEPEGDEG